MSRAKSIQKRSLKVRKSKRLQQQVVFKTQLPNACRILAFTSQYRRSVDFVPIFRHVLTLLITEPLTKPTTNLQLIRNLKPEPKFYLLSASVCYRIIRWTKKSPGILDRAIRCRDFKKAENEFEIFLSKKFGNFVARVSENFQQKIEFVQNQEFQSEECIFLTGTPDFALLDQHSNPVCVVECKDITSENEFNKIFIRNDSGCVVVKQNHEYIYQLKMYLLIVKAPIGLLIIRFQKNIFVTKVKYSGVDYHEFISLRNFYLFYYLPKITLGTNPVQKCGTIQYFNFQEIRILNDVLRENHHIFRHFDYEPQNFPNPEIFFMDKFSNQIKK